MMDEFANVALPDNFERILATMRSRRISVSIIIQNMAQLKALFKDSYESLVGNCDTFIYLGGNEQGTHEYISKMLGKETIDTRTRGITKGQHGSSNTNYQNTGRELLTLDEVRLLDNSNELIFIRGEKPIMDKKFDVMSHPNIKLTEDGGALTMASPAFADDPLAAINGLSDFIFSAIKAIGFILLGFGVVQIGLSLKSHDASQRANGFLTFFGGVVIAFAKDILDMIL